MRFVADRHDPKAGYFLSQLSAVVPTAEVVVLDSVDAVGPEDIFVCSTIKPDLQADQAVSGRIILANAVIPRLSIGTNRILICDGTSDHELTPGRLTYVAGIVRGMLKGSFPYSVLWGILYRPKQKSFPEDQYAWGTPYAMC